MWDVRFRVYKLLSHSGAPKFYVNLSYIELSSVTILGMLGTGFRVYCVAVKELKSKPYYVLHVHVTVTII